MNDLKKIIEDNNIARIEKLVNEFEIWELEKIPYGKFKIKIFESLNGSFIGRTNLMVIDKTGEFCSGIGYGKNVEEALGDTIRYFYSLIDEVDNLNEQCFSYVDPTEF